MSTDNGFEITRSAEIPPGRSAELESHQNSQLPRHIADALNGHPGLAEIGRQLEPPTRLSLAEVGRQIAERESSRTDRDRMMEHVAQIKRDAEEFDRLPLGERMRRLGFADPQTVKPLHFREF